MLGSAVHVSAVHQCFSGSFLPLDIGGRGQLLVKIASVVQFCLNKPLYQVFSKLHACIFHVDMTLIATDVAK